VIKRTNLLPSICGRVCPQEGQCQAPCTLGKSLKSIDKAVQIGRLERFVADWERSSGAAEAPAAGHATGKRVAIVGAGPAGVAAAHHLSLHGHHVVIFEREERAGGLLPYGFPEFRQ
ncbi:FAD-dependent oxidoreductase, partial [Citrobacter sp. AAK_AS5]